MSASQISIKKKFFFTGILLWLSGTFAFIGLEFYVRATRSVTDLKVLTGRVSGPDPMAEWAFMDAFAAYRIKPGINFYSARKTVNQEGFISTPEISVSKPPGTFRIVFLGGSAAAGMGRDLEDVETWPWKTIEMIRQKTNKKVDFINGAVGGYTSFESYGRLWSRIRHYSPDIIVVYHGWNEMYYFLQVDKITQWRTLPDGSWSIGKTTSKPIKQYEPYWLDPILYWSQALTRIRLKLSRHLGGEAGTNPSRFLSPDFDRRGLEIWRTNLKLLKSTSEIIGAKLFVAKQPTLIVPGLPESERGRNRYEYHGFNHDAHVRAFQAIYEVTDQEIPADSVIDVTEVSGHPEYFYDHVHPTPEGSTKIAHIMSDFLLPYIEKKEDSSNFVPGPQ
ncbi:MAG: SGNH/GDSL hydrolase family protein [Desulfobacterales bacterium]|nr:SGNH/GDSL hydrolase family protein [Desulfobacterales bacterium]